MWAFFGIVMGLIVLGLGILLKTYRAPSVSLSVTLMVGYAWLVTLSVIALVPLDVWAALQDDPPPPPHDLEGLKVLWSISYWSTQALTWLLIPLLTGFAAAGDFTKLDKLKRSLRYNLVFYSILGVLGLIGLLIIIIRFSLSKEKLLTYGMTLSNAYGLVVTILLMGIGLVEIPRNLWRRCNLKRMLLLHYHRAGVYSEKLENAAMELETTLLVVEATNRQISRRNPLRQYVDRVLTTATRHSPIPLAPLVANGVDLDLLAVADLDYGQDKGSLAALRTRLKQAIHTYHSQHYEYTTVIRRALEVQEILDARQAGLWVPRRAQTSAKEGVVWWYRCLVAPTLGRLTAAVLGVMSLLVVWSEVTIPIPKNLSPFSKVVHAHEGDHVGVQVLVLVPLIYMVFCSYYGLFQLAALVLYRLVPGHTDSQTLLTHGSLSCRFAAPLAYNFLYMIHMDEERGASATVFSKVLGLKGVVVLGNSLNSLYPITLGVHAALLAFNAWDRLFGACLPKRLQFDLTGQGEEGSDTVEKGRRIVAQEGQAVQLNRPIGASYGSMGHEDGLGEVDGKRATSRDGLIAGGAGGPAFGLEDRQQRRVHDSPTNKGLLKGSERDHSASQGSIELSDGNPRPGQLEDIFKDIQESTERLAAFDKRHGHRH